MRLCIIFFRLQNWMSNQSQQAGRRWRVMAFFKPLFLGLSPLGWAVLLLIVLPSHTSRIECELCPRFSSQMTILLVPLKCRFVASDSQCHPTAATVTTPLSPWDFQKKIEQISKTGTETTQQRPAPGIYLSGSGVHYPELLSRSGILYVYWDQ